MADNNYKRLQDIRSSEIDIHGGMQTSAPGEEGRTPPPPYEIDLKKQPYGMMSSPVNPMSVGIPQQEAGYGQPNQQVGFGQPQQQGGYGPPQPSQPSLQPQVYNIIAQPQITGPTSVGQDPVRLQCPSCREFIKSKVDRSCTSKTHCWACCLFLCLCWPCMCVPYCMNSCRDANHTCPNCKTFLGTYKA